MEQRARERLGERIRPDGGVVLLTVECQQGVVGPESALPELAAAARASGVLRNVARLVAAAHEADVQVIHAVAERRPDGRGPTATPGSSGPPPGFPYSSTAGARRYGSPNRSRSPRRTSSYGGCTGSRRSPGRMSTRCSAISAAGP